MIKFSIIVPIYNREKYIQECIESIINQYGRDVLFEMEIILIDDGSIDNSANICKAFLNKYSFIKYIYQENSGVSVARNKGLSNSNGKYIYFMDSDDTINKLFFKEVTEKINETECDLVIVGINAYNQAKRFIEKMTTCPVWGVVIKRDYIIKNNFSFKTGLQNMEDSLFCWQLLAKTNSIEKAEKTIYNYRKTTNSLSSRIVKDKKYYSDILITIIDEIKNFYFENINKKGVKDHTLRFLADTVFYQLIISKISLSQKLKIYKQLRKFVKSVGFQFIDKKYLDFKLRIFYTLFDLVILF